MTLHIARLSSRALIRVAGPDARSFLQGLLTQDIETLGADQVRFAALLSPPGRVLFDLFVWGEDEAVILDVAADRREALMGRLSMYRLRAQVEITTDDRAVWASWPGVAEGFVPDPRLTALGGRGLRDEADPNALEADYHAHRLTVGVPDPDADVGSDRTYPIEANFDLLNGIDFHKGCFVGQETTSRMKRRGAIRSRMVPLAVEGAIPSSGSEVLNGDLRAGEVLTGMDGVAMALVRLDRLDGALSVDGQAVRVRKPDWIVD
jgi:hypothetical protein